MEPASSSQPEDPAVKPNACVRFGRAVTAVPRDTWELLKLLHDAFGVRTLAYLSLMYFLVKGFAYQMLSYVLLPFYKQLGVPVTDYQRYYNTAMMGWAAKPLIGVLSDMIPILGYHKRIYLAFFSLSGTAALLTMMLLPPQVAAGQMSGVIFFMFILSIASMDLLCEGKYSELLQKKSAATGAAIITWVYWSYQLGSIAAASVEGPLADSSDPKIVLWCVVPATAVLFLPTIFGWLPEERVLKRREAASVVPEDEIENAKTRQSLAASQVRLSAPVVPTAYVTTAQHQKVGMMALGVFVSACAITLVFVSIYATFLVQFAYLAACGLVLIATSIFVLPAVVAKANIFMFVREICYLQITGALDYFYTATPQCLPGGPGFSYTYYQTFVNIAGAIAGLIAVGIFQRFLSRMMYSRVFWLTTAMKILGSLFDIVLIERWNVKIGIPDHVMYMLGDAVIQNAVSMLDFMPSAVLLSKVCPKGMETTVFALLAGFSNFGQGISRALGTLLIQRLDIQAPEAPCNFSNLSVLVIVGHMCMPVLILPLAWLLLPAKHMSDDVDAPSETPSDATSPALPPESTVESPLIAAPRSSSANDDFVDRM